MAFINPVAFLTLSPLFSDIDGAREAEMHFLQVHSHGEKGDGGGVVDPADKAVIARGNVHGAEPFLFQQTAN